MSRRSRHLEVIWPETAECSLMRRQTLRSSKNSRNMDKEKLGMTQVFWLLNEDFLAVLTYSRYKHNAEACKYRQLVSYSKGTNKNKSRQNAHINFNKKIIIHLNGFYINKTQQEACQSIILHEWQNWKVWSVWICCFCHHHCMYEISKWKVVVTIL